MFAYWHIDSLKKIESLKGGMMNSSLGIIIGIILLIVMWVVWNIFIDYVLGKRKITNLSIVKWFKENFVEED